MENATSSITLLWWRVPVDPSGETSVWDYLQTYESLDDARRRVYSNDIQVFMNATMFAVFLRNTWRAILLVKHKPASTASWCCLIQAGMGVATQIVNLSTVFPNGATCRTCNWVYSTGITVSSICVSICLLLRAYVITNRSRLLLLVGILLMLPLPGTIWIFWVASLSQNSPDYACTSIFPWYLPWFRLGLDMSINSVFSIIFLRVIIQQYKKMGNGCWKKLQSDGIIYLCCVVLSNILCALIVAFKIIGGLSEMMFIYDWLITSSLLIRQHEGMRKAFSTYEGFGSYKKRRHTPHYQLVEANSRHLDSSRFTPQ
ncbi:hypothetical protein BDF22DRAFT_666868 [Syncephalis plumigaleata]|nr:hypothetical protein BDF22DRAFT_666868 [Syncephalis plumigaleata]